MERAREGTLKPVAQSNGEATKTAAKRKGRWDQSTEDTPSVKKPVQATPNSQATPSWDTEVRNIFDSMKAINVVQSK